MTNKAMPERIAILRSDEDECFCVAPLMLLGNQKVCEYIRADLVHGDSDEPLTIGGITQIQAIWIQCKLTEMACLADEILSSKAKTYLENIDFEQTSVYNYYVDPRGYSENIESINSLQAVYQDALYFTEQYERIKKALADVGAQPLPWRPYSSPHAEYLNKFPTTRPNSDKKDDLLMSAIFVSSYFSNDKTMRDIVELVNGGSCEFIFGVGEVIFTSNELAGQYAYEAWKESGNGQVFDEDTAYAHLETLENEGASFDYSKAVAHAMKINDEALS